MPWQKKSKPKAERVVRHKQRDGTVKEYRYKSYQPPAGPKKTDTLSVLIDNYKDSPEWSGLAPTTRTRYTIYLRPLERFGHLDPASIKRRDILTLRDALASTSGNGAANAFITVAGQLFAWGINREWLEHNPVTKIEALPGGHLRAWTLEQTGIALQQLPEHLRRVVILGIYTGQRRGDLCAMRWDAYDGANIRLIQQKTKEELVIPVHPDLKAELDAWKREASALTILTNANGRPWKPALLSYHMPSALTRIGLPDNLNVHGLRKLTAANLADEGSTPNEIKSVTGHRTLAMVELYTRSADQERLARGAVLRLPSLQKIYKIKKPD